tara:strand:+ start:668 stop:1285 length:618 start_codon:yes stop_codon:yes gene_type:complete
MNNLIKRMLSSIILLPLVIYCIFKGSFYLMFLIVICFFVSSFEWHKMIKKKAYKLLGFLFLIFSFYSFYKLSIELVVIIPLFICVFTDIGGYVFGKILRGPKLIRISPNKTYAGMIGGFFLSILFVSIYFNIINHKLTIQWLITTFVVSLISQIGDIIISYFKRLSNLKNTGKIIPGHGGLLDRIDGMIFAFPAFYLIYLIGLLN